MAQQALKRFYKQAKLRDENAHYGIDLDGRPLKSPAGELILIESQMLVNAICDEWNNQQDIIDVSTMPLYGIFVTQIDKTASQRQDILQNLIPYIDGDLLFYHAPEPQGLRLVQEQLWGRILKDTESLCGIDLTITHDLGSIQQSPHYHDYIMDTVEGMNDAEFTVFHILTSVTGSVILSLLGTLGKLSEDEIIKTINAEEDYYIKLYHDELSPDQLQKRIDVEQTVKSCLTYRAYI